MFEEKFRSEMGGEWYMVSGKTAFRDNALVHLYGLLSAPLQANWEAFVTVEESPRERKKPARFEPEGRQPKRASPKRANKRKAPAKKQKAR